MTEQELNEEIEKIQLKTGEEDEDLIRVLICDAEEQVLGYTNRTRLIPQLKKSVRDLAVIALNRIGTEGESGRSEGGESYQFSEMPNEIYSLLNRFRLARVGGKVFETSQK